jgi:hypothetical protein
VTAAAGAFVAAPDVAGTSDGNAVVGWTQDIDVRLQKLDSDGAALWGSGVTLSHATDEFLFSDLEAADAGTAIVSFIHQPEFMAPKHLWAQKPAWADGEVRVRLYDGASGAFEGEKTWTVRGRSLIQVNNVIRAINPDYDGAEKRIEVEVDKAVFMNAFRVNRWGDPVTLSPFPG